MEDKKHFFKLLKFDGLSIPQYTEKFNKTTNMIDFGNNNMMPNYYLSLMARSAKHNAIVKGKAQMIAGNGWDRTDISNDAYTFLKNIYNEMDLDEIASRCAYDLEIYGAFCLNLIWSRDRTRVSEINYINPQTVRIQVPNKDYPQQENYFICQDWENWRRKEVVLYPGFSLVDKEKASQILYVKEYRPGRVFYGEPEYISAVNWIEMEYEISQFHLSNINNGFAPSLMINFPTGIPSDEEMDIIMKQLDNQYKGAKGAGNRIFTFSENKDTAPIISTIETNNNDEKFIQLNEEITQGIMSGHRVNNPALFGIRDNSGMVIGKSDLLDSLEIFQSQYVSPKQMLIEKVFRRIARINGINDKLMLNEYQIKFSKTDLQISDILSILQSTMSSASKIALLTSSGYTTEEAIKLVGDSTDSPITSDNTKTTGVSKPSVGSTPSTPVEDKQEAPVNENLKNLSAKQHQQMMRTIRQYNKGQLTREAASTLLKSSLGLNDNDVNSLLGDEEEETPKAHTGQPIKPIGSKPTINNNK